MSVIDLTWASTKAMALDATKEWAIDPTLACSLDHFALKWVIDYGTAKVQNITGTRYNFKETKPEEWQEIFSMEMEKNAERWASLQKFNTEHSPEELDEDVKLITEAMKTATKETVKEKKPLDKARPWWTKDLGEANKRRMQLHEEQRAYTV